MRWRGEEQQTEKEFVVKGIQIIFLKKIKKTSKNKNKNKNKHRLNDQQSEQLLVVYKRPPVVKKTKQKTKQKRAHVTICIQEVEFLHFVVSINLK